VHEQLRAGGLAGRQLMDATRAIAKPALGLVEPALLYFHRRGWKKASRDDFLRHLAEATTPPAQRPGETSVAVMFVDLAGFTPLTLALGDQGVAGVLRAFSRIVRGRAGTSGGRIVKQIGDAFMLVFDRPGDAVGFGLDAMRDTCADPDLPGLHIGAHWGRALYREGDYYGSTVNLAARVASSTESGQFLVTAELHQAAAELAQATYRALPPRPVKGVADAVHMVDVRACAGLPTRVEPGGQRAGALPRRPRPPARRPASAAPPPARSHPGPRPGPRARPRQRLPSALAFLPAGAGPPASFL
jgi:adenylate cyclase